MFKRMFWMFIIVLGMGLSACAQEADPVDEVVPDDNEEVLVSQVIPADYPSEVLPIFPNGFVEVAVSLNRSYTIAVYYEEDPSVLIAFYKEHIKDASDLIVTETATTYTAFGGLQDHTFNLDIGPSTNYPKYPTSLYIVLTFNQK